MIARRVVALVALLIILPSGWSQVAHADGECNQFERVQSIVLSEAAGQPLAAQIEVARVVVTKGACFLDRNFYTGYAIADDVHTAHPSDCIANWHCRAYYELYSIDPAIRESAAVSAYVALTEQPPVRRFHEDAAAAPMAWWWFDPRACPDGWFVIGEVRVC